MGLFSLLEQVSPFALLDALLADAKDFDDALLDDLVSGFERSGRCSLD